MAIEEIRRQHAFGNQLHLPLRAVEGLAALIFLDDILFANNLILFSVNRETFKTGKTVYHRVNMGSHSD